MVRAVHKLFRLSPRSLPKELPEQYIKYYEQSLVPPERVLDEAPKTKFLDYDQDHETGYVYRVPDHPIHVIKTPLTDKGLWAGIGMVEGFHKPKKLRPRAARLWYPSIQRHTFYSDILDLYINVEVTDRALELIDQHQGFDFYILKTRVQDLGSEFGRRLQHKLLLKLATDDREYIKEKYASFLKPRKEIEWHGLKVSEAIAKQRAMRLEETIDPPLKVKYATELIRELQQSAANGKTVDKIDC